MVAPSLSGLTVLGNFNTNGTRTGTGYSSSSFPNPTTGTEPIDQDTNLTSTSAGIEGFAARIGFIDAYSNYTYLSVRFSMAQLGASSPQNFSTNKFIIHIRPDDISMFKVAASNGMRLRVYSTETTAYREYRIGGRDMDLVTDAPIKRNSDSWFSIVIDLASSSIATATVGSFDPSSVVSWEFMISMHYPEFGFYQTRVRLDRFCSANLISLINGDVGTPGTFNSFYEYLNNTNSTSLSLAVGGAYVFKIPAAIGDGSTSTRFVDSDKSIIFPSVTRTSTTALLYLEPNYLGLQINQSASDVLILNRVSVSSETKWVFNVSGSSSASFTWNGGVISNVGTNSLSGSANFANVIFSGCDRINPGANRVFTDCLFTGTTSTTGAFTWDGTQNITGSSFTNNTTATGAIRIVLSGDLTVNLNSNTFSGNTNDFVVTGSGNLTIVVDAVTTTDKTWANTTGGVTANGVNASGLAGNVTFTAPSVTFAAPNINSGGFDNVRCRTSLYKRISFTNAEVNATTNQITLSGVTGKITQNTIIRLAGSDLPAPLEADQVFYPRTISGNSFTLSNTPGGGGSDINLTDTGSGPMVAILTTELNIALVTSGGYSFGLNSAASTAGVTLASNDTLLFQAVHWEGSLQTVSPCVASKYHEELQAFQGGNITTLTNLDPYTEHDLFAIRQATDGYEISQLTVSGSSPTRYQWRVDASTPGKVQIESEDPDRVISTELAVLFFQFVQWTEAGIRLFRGQIFAENLNSIRIQSPEIGLDADLTVESFPVGIPLLVNGPGMYRTDGATWIAVGSPIQHQPTALVAVPITVEKAVNLSPEVMQLLHSIAAGTAISTQATGSGLDAAGVRSAIGLASANLDTQLSNIPSAVWSATTRTLSSGANIVLPNSQTFSTSGSVGSISGVTFPTNFGVLAIAPTTGFVSVGTNNDKTGYSLTQSFPTNFSDLAITAGGSVTAGTVSDKSGYSLSATQTFNLTGNITGNLSGSVGSVTSAVTLPAIPNNWITAAGIATDAIDGDAISASAVTEIQSGLATSSEISAIPTNPLLTTDARLNNLDATISSRLATAGYTAPANANITTILNNTNRVDALITNPGGGDRFTTLSLSNAPSSGGSGATPAQIWDYALTSITTAGSVGRLIKDNLNVVLSTRFDSIDTALTNQPTAFWNFGTRTLTSTAGLTTQQNDRLNEVWQILGLNSSNPVTASNTARVSGTISQTIVTNVNGSKTMTRT